MYVWQRMKDFSEEVVEAQPPCLCEPFVLTSAGHLSGAHMHDSTALLAGPCACKSKSCVVTNHDISPIYSKMLDDTKYGAQSVVSQAPAN